jgi:spermidine synthase
VEAENFGRVLVLDSVVQTSTADHFFFHEMLVHTPLFSLDNPRRVLIVGIGSGGALKEILKHGSVEEVVGVEIDRMVLETCAAHMPSLNDQGRIFRDPKVKIHFEDGLGFLKKYEGSPFDAILINSTDPNPVSNSLFGAEFYGLCLKALSPTGVLIAQTGAPSLERQLVQEVSRILKPLFAHHGCFITSVPTYMCGYFTLSWASPLLDLKKIPFETLNRRFKKSGMNCAVYNPGLHRASFELPNWYHHLIKSPDSSRLHEADSRT